MAPSVLIEATENQAHYLGTVMRRSPGDDIHLFNGHDGEWSARIETLGRGKGLFRVDRLLRPQAGDTDVWLAFALLKRDTTDLVVQKATELGVAALLPVVTERTNAARVNEDRLRAIAVEAAEQSERMTVPMIQPPRKLADVLTFWPADRPLFAALERTDAPPIHPVPGPCGLLIGPEGGFGPRDYALLERAPTLRPVGLGPRILRAETAAIAGLALLQATGWR